MTATLSPQGVLDFETVPVIWKELSGQCQTASRIQLDLSAVTQCNSAALALLIALMTEADRQHKSISIVNIPPRLLEIAAACGIRTLLERMT